jgi:hypothetical protein
VVAESLAENPVLTDAKSQHPASTATEQKRPNAINPSPVELLPTQFFELKPPAYARKPQTPVPRHGRTRIFNFRGVLVLARPSDREDGTSRTGTPEFSAENPR